MAISPEKRRVPISGHFYQKRGNIYDVDLMLRFQKVKKFIVALVDDRLSSVIRNSCFRGQRKEDQPNPHALQLSVKVDDRWKRIPVAAGRR